MTDKTTLRLCFIIFLVSIYGTPFFWPEALSDYNPFLKDFVGSNFLNYLGVVVTITLASAASLHIELNKYEDNIKKNVFTKTRTAIKKSAYSLIILLPISFSLVVIEKPFYEMIFYYRIWEPNIYVYESFINGTALIIILFSIFILLDLTGAAFKLKPIYEDSEA